MRKQDILTRRATDAVFEKFATDEDIARQIVKAVLGKERVYIDSQDDAPEGVDVQEGTRGGLYYETSQSATADESENESEAIAEDMRNAISAGVESDVDNPIRNGVAPIGSKSVDEWPIHEDTDNGSTSWVPIEQIWSEQEEVDLGTVRYLMDRLRNGEDVIPAQAKPGTDLYDVQIQDGNHTAVAGWLLGYDRVPISGLPISDRYDAVEDESDWLYSKARRYVDSPDDVPEGVQVQEGERGGTYYETGDGGEGESSDTGNNRDDESDEADPVDEGREYAVNLPRPEDGELVEYIEEVHSTEWWQEGHEAFKQAWKEGDNTENKYSTETEDGERVWDEDRVREVHEPAVEKILNEDAASENPIAVMLIGPPGAGKGWWEENYGDRFDREFTRISSDDTKEVIPEYDGANASSVHDEASHIAKEYIAPQAIEKKHNVIIDKVATTPDSTLKMKENLNKQGYDMRAVFVDVPEEKSVYNVVQRYDDEGRFTPLDYVAEARDKSIASFKHIAEDFDNEKVSYYWNDVEWGEPLEEVVSGEGVFKYVQTFKMDASVSSRSKDGETRGPRPGRDGEGDTGISRREVGVGTSTGDGAEGRGVEKERRYVNSPDEAPEGADVQ